MGSCLSAPSSDTSLRCDDRPERGHFSSKRSNGHLVASTLALDAASEVASGPPEHGNGIATFDPRSLMGAHAGIQREIIFKLLALPVPGAIGALALSCKDMAAEWRAAVRSLPSLATYLTARVGEGNAEAAIKHVLSRPSLLAMVRDLGREQNQTLVAALVTLAQLLLPPQTVAPAKADGVRGTAAPSAAVAAAPAATTRNPEAAERFVSPAATAVIAAAATVADGAMVADVLRHCPGCCGQAQLDGLLAEAALAGRAGVVRPLLELGGANVREALARGWRPLAAMDAGQSEVVEMMARHGGLQGLQSSELKALADKAVAAGASRLFNRVLRSPGFTPYVNDFAGWLATASRRGHTGMVRLLLPPVTQREEPHRSHALTTSLTAAVGASNAEAVALLVQAMGSGR